MTDREEFRKFAVKGQGLSGTMVDDYLHEVTDMTQYVIEERPGNFRAIDVFTRLISDRIIFLGMGIDDQIANIITAQLLFLQSTDSKKDVQMYINSPGGNVYAGLGIYDTMNYIGPDIATICTGLAASMGAILLTAGTKGKRSALPHARVMIHQPMAGAGGQASDIEISVQQSIELKKELFEILASHTGNSVDQIEKDSDRDRWMKSKAAKEYGLIDEVLERSE